VANEDFLAEIATLQDQLRQSRDETEGARADAAAKEGRIAVLEAQLASREAVIAATTQQYGDIMMKHNKVINVLSDISSLAGTSKVTLGTIRSALVKAFSDN
jgi:hypothetical protein